MDTLGSGQAGGGSSVQPASASLDISQRSDVQKLRKHGIGLGGVLFISFAAMSPLTGQLGNAPIAVGLGNGIGAPAGSGPSGTCGPQRSSRSSPSRRWASRRSPTARSGGRVP